MSARGAAHPLGDAQNLGIAGDAAHHLATVGDLIQHARLHPEPAVSALPATREIGIRSYIGVPLRLEDARLYVLCCLSRERRPHLGDREVTFLRGVAESIRGQLDG